MNSHCISMVTAFFFPVTFQNAMFPSVGPKTPSSSCLPTPWYVCVGGIPLFIIYKLLRFIVYKSMIINIFTTSSVVFCHSRAKCTKTTVNNFDCLRNWMTAFFVVYLVGDHNSRWHTKVVSTKPVFVCYLGIGSTLIYSYTCGYVQIRDIYR